MRKKRCYISVVVPLYNEEENVVELYNELKEVLGRREEEYEIIFVNDGSSDTTEEKLKDLAKGDKRVKVISLSRQYGQTSALAAGIDFASGDVIITMDGDLQHNPEEIPFFLEEINKGWDVVTGWRKKRLDNFFLRQLPSYLANSLMRWISGIKVRDFGSTFKAYKAPVIKQIELFGELHRFIPVLAVKGGAKIKEIPINIRERKGGKSKYGIKRAFGVFEDLIFLYFYLHYLQNPIRAFGKLFFLFFGAGFLISTALMVLWLFGVIGAVIEHGALLLFSVFLMVTGVQFLVGGIVAELLSRIYFRTGQLKIYSVRK